jgi:flagellar biosynthesis protein FlhA
MLEALRANTREFALVGGLILILVVLFSPIPPMFLDLAILVNFGLSLTILLLTLYVTKPVEFSTFPSLLLISTLLRLSLNVAATRLILTDGDAGQVINAIGTFAVAANFIVGLVVFFILIVVQYVVVTSGAQRVSEVAARFMLDSMPGQQMSIDADLNMGLIDQKEAVRRRAELEKEASFYGAMDGASKFVKGDAIAGVIILLINIIAGWIIGIVQMGMDWQTALQHFSLLTVGDGIATQMPALIVSIATGIIVTRSSADKELSTEILRQLSSVPRILVIVGCVLCLLLLLPGMPKWPIIVIASGLFLFWLITRRRAQPKVHTDAANAEDAAEEQTSIAPTPLSVAFGPSLSEAWRDRNVIFMERIATLRDAHEKAHGIAFPAVKIVDGPHLGTLEYEISIYGARHASGEIDPARTLAIKGEHTQKRLEGRETLDPAFGLPAVWIEEDHVREAREAGFTIVDPVTVLITHLGEVLRAAAPALLTRAMTAKLLEDVRQRQKGLIEEFVPNLLSVSDVQRVLQNLLSEAVSIAAIDLIAEHLVDLARTEKDIGALTELLRQRMSHTICDRLRGRHRDLAVISFDPRLENQIQVAASANAKRDSLFVDPKLAERMIRKLVALSADMLRQGREPVLLCSADIRRQLRTLTRRSVPRLSILAVTEIPTHVELKSFGIVRTDDDSQPKAEAALAGANNA